MGIQTPAALLICIAARSVRTVHATPEVQRRRSGAGGATRRWRPLVLNASLYAGWVGERCPGLTRRPCPFAHMVSAAQESALSTRELGAMACPHEPRAAGQSYEAASEPFEAMIRSKAAVGNANREGRSPAYERLHWVSLAREHVSHVVARPKVCEIGLNTGHSALAWLCALPTATYHSFDLVRFDVTRGAIPLLNRSFPGRFELTAGSTHETLPALARAAAPPYCDVTSIDGDHSYHGALQDLRDMRRLAAPGSFVVMDDLWCAASWCGPPTRAWTTAIHSGWVRQAGCEVLGCCTGWCWGTWLPDV
mmetsp:Transcript_4973/g.16165  ORF Transcript_4973/g.16165 Transcript_4973/m.16165 type:complete len:308 (-) Transcript_4973:66-989(-)